MWSGANEVLKFSYQTIYKSEVHVLLLNEKKLKKKLD